MCKTFVIVYFDVYALVSDWSRLPLELKIKVKRGKKLRAVFKPKLLPSDSVSRNAEAKKEDISQVLAVSI
jgi:hypothetical protein